MYTVRVRTTQSVVIDYPLSGVGDRILAFLIGGLILSAYAGLSWLAVSDRDIKMIKQALEVNRERGHIKSVMMLIDKLKTMCGIESEMQPMTLLQTVVKNFTMLTAGK